MKLRKHTSQRKSIRPKVAEQIKKDRQQVNAQGRERNRELAASRRQPRETITLSSGEIRNIMEWAWLRKAKARGDLHTFGVVGKEGDKNASI